MSITCARLFLVFAFLGEEFPMDIGTITLIPDGDCGFIRPAHGRDDISFLQSALVDVTAEHIHAGDRVTFTVVHDLRGKGPRAVDVRMALPPEATVRSSKRLTR